MIFHNLINLCILEFTADIFKGYFINLECLDLFVCMPQETNKAVISFFRKSTSGSTSRM